MTFDYWSHKGHSIGECMSHPAVPLMYVHIPKNASSWTKPNLLDWQWEFYNFRTDKLNNKLAMVVLRDPLNRWLSGIAEYFALYHNELDIEKHRYDKGFLDLVFDRIAFDDHTERQLYFLQGLDLSNCVWFRCDDTYREKFTKFLNSHGISRDYTRYDYQHTSEDSPPRQKFKNFFSSIVEENSKYCDAVKNYFHEDYKLINKVKFYD